MTFFFCKLNPPRPTFAQDMSAGERALMQRHAAYWTEFSWRGTVVIFGPVADPAGTWGMCVVEVEDAAAARALIDGDPVITANAGFRFDVHPMPQAILRP